jgi:hypothetical protein
VGVEPTPEMLEALAQIDIDTLMKLLKGFKVTPPFIETTP